LNNEPVDIFDDGVSIDAALERAFRETVLHHKAPRRTDDLWDGSASLSCRREFGRAGGAANPTEGEAALEDVNLANPAWPATAIKDFIAHHSPSRANGQVRCDQVQELVLYRHGCLVDRLIMSVNTSGCDKLGAAFIMFSNCRR